MKIENGVLREVINEDIVNNKFIIPDSVTEIRNRAFYNCNNLESIIIPNSVTKICDWAFANCYNLTSITIPDSVIKIGHYVFDYCKTLEEINVNDENKYYSSENGILFNKTKLIKYPEGKKGKKYIIPNSIIEIGDYAFENCANLKSIFIPDSVTEIREGAFYKCNNLTSINIPHLISKIENGAFYNCNKLQSKEGNYKAFKKGLVCNYMQYIPNEWNKVDGDIEICNWGLHYVTNLFDVFNYYSGDLEQGIEIWEIEVGNIVVDNDEDSKKATNAIKPIKRLSRQEIINILNNK